MGPGVKPLAGWRGAEPFPVGDPRRSGKNKHNAFEGSTNGGALKQFTQLKRKRQQGTVIKPVPYPAQPQRKEPASQGSIPLTAGLLQY